MQLKLLVSSQSEKAAQAAALIARWLHGQPTSAVARFRHDIELIALYSHTLDHEVIAGTGLVKVKRLHFASRGVLRLIGHPKNNPRQT
jgi:hypothetical protein